jgi:hypothetical protein
MPTQALETPPVCRHCGALIRWQRTPQGFVPFSGAMDHREACAGISRATRAKIREKNHEARVAAFLGASP